jgi:hypothetical protein
MRRRGLIIVGVAVVFALGLTGGAIATDTIAQDDEASATGPEADRASAAALEAVGGGRVSEIERDPEGLRVWKVEIVNASGALVDVELDGNYKVVQNPDDDVNDAPEAPETEAQDAADDAADANEPNDDVGDVHEADDVNDTENDADDD